MTIRDDVVEMCRAIGLEVHGNNVYGTVDSIAILLDLLLCEDEQECSEELKLSVLARSIAETPFCAESRKVVDQDQKL